MRESVRFITYGVVTAAAVGIFACSGVSAFLDDHLLLENTNPAYYEDYANATYQMVPVDVADNGLINLVVNNLTTRDYDQGFRITVYEDGSITYSGKNNTKNPVYITITSSNWNLQDGSYILTDSPYGMNGAPVSGDGIKLYVDVCNYRVGGVTESAVAADMTDLSSIIFYVDHSQYTDYLLRLEIAPAYESDGITFYPMVTHYDDQTDAYHPCMLYNRKAVIASNEVDNAGEDAGETTAEAVTNTAASAGSYSASESAESKHAVETTYYDYYSVDKSDYLALSEDDLTLLDRRIRYQYSGRWSTIAFDDGTGIYYPNNDPDLAEYGELNAIGQVELLYGGLDQIMLIERPLNKVTAFADFLQLLNNPDYTILLAIRDDGVSALTEDLMTELQELGVQTPLTETTENSDGTTFRTYYRNSYYAVLNPGTDAVEAASEDELTYAGTTRDGKASFTIHSAGYLNEAPDGSILVNGEECSMNRRGMNIVVYDNVAGEIVDQVTFDTCTGLKAYRVLDAGQN